MESIWTQSVTLPAREPLRGHIEADIAVIGGGLCGILTAYFLQRQGAQVVVLEASRTGSGQTKNTTAKITSQHNLIYHSLIQNFGEKKAKQYADANQQAIEEYQNIIQEQDISCDFERCPAYLYSTEDTEQLKLEQTAAKQLGIDAKLTTDTELPFSVKSAMKFEEQARFHPLKFLKAVSHPLVVYEDTMVKSVKENLITTGNGTIKAKYIVFCTHYPFLNTPGYYFMRMHQERSYVLALENAGRLNGVYLGIDQDGYSFRSIDNYLILGGGGHRTGENSAGGKYKDLRNKAASFYPGCNEKAHWSAQDCMTLDGVPYIGQFAASTPGWYVATGFGKWGMSSSMVSAMILSDLILKKKNSYADVFSPQRFSLSASAKTLAEEGLQATKGLVRGLFGPGREQLEQLPNGHGGVVEHEGIKMGVYKDEQGQIFMVSNSCTHLGCQLEWNPDEKSWDCPCHGSRFDYHGNLIDNPAMEGLSHELHP